jgi:glycosyltransferase involved in cell wall biosynthesis
MNTVSTIIPVYNREKFIPRAIDSVLSQTRGEFELIIVDDGSTDGTKDVIESYDDDRVVLLPFNSNKGANAARNAGIEYATGEFITFLDSDDEYDDEFIETTTEHLSDLSANVGGVYTSRRRIYDNKEIDIDFANQVLTTPKSALHDYQAYGFSNWVFRAEVFDNVGMLDETLSGLQDREFLIRYLKKYEFHPIREVLVTQYKHSGQMSAKPELKLEALNNLQSKHSNLIDGEAQSYFDYYIGWRHANNGDIETAKQYFWRAFRQNPFKFKYQLQAFASMLGKNGFEIINDFKQWSKHKILRLLTQIEI